MNHLDNLTKTLLQQAKEEGNKPKKAVYDNELWLYVEAFGHKYIIQNPYTRKCKIIQEDISNDNLHY